MKGRVLIVAGSDSGGGAGIQADIKTLTALNAYASTAITALTAQDTRGVHGVVPIAPEFVRRQMRVVLDDIGADAIKTGMLHDSAIIDAVCDVIEQRRGTFKLVVDPVMVAKGNTPLLDPDAVATLKRRLIVHAAIITPNLPEAERLAGMSIRSVQDMVHAASAMLTFGCEAALVKGGHLESDKVTDVLATASGIELYESKRIETRHTHGTGCTLASAIAAGLAQGLGIEDAVERARAFVRRAIETAPGLGAGHGPLNHAHAIPPFMFDDD